MRKGIAICFFVPVIVIISACTTFRRYSSEIKPGIDSTLADIDLFGLRLSQTKPLNETKSLWDLSADAQSQFIKILNSRFPDNNDFLNTLSLEYMNGREEPEISDYASKDLRLIFSVSRKSPYFNSISFKTNRLSSADRLEYLKISLILRDPSLSFTGWNIYSTEYGSIDIGDLSFDRSLEIKGSAALSAKKVNNGRDLSAGAATLISRSEDQTLKQRYLKLSGRINKQKIEMEEEGTREIDLTGNIIADVSLKFDSSTELITRFNGLKDSTGAFRQPEKVSANTFLVKVPEKKDIDEFIMADLKMDYVYRNVVGGRRTFPEWDDRVKYYTGSAVKTIPLFTARDYVPGFYGVGSVSENGSKDLIAFERGTDDQYPLIMGSYEEATAFYTWLINSLNINRTKPVKIGGQSLKFRNSDLTYELIKKESRFYILPYYW